MKIAAPSKNDHLDRCAEAGLQETVRVSRLSPSGENRGRPRNMCCLNSGSASSCRDAFFLPLAHVLVHPNAGIPLKLKASGDSVMLSSEKRAPLQGEFAMNPFLFQFIVLRLYSDSDSLEGVRLPLVVRCFSVIIPEKDIYSTSIINNKQIMCNLQSYVAFTVGFLKGDTKVFC